MRDLTIFLVTHNRLHDAIRAIGSILNQKNQIFDLVVSDNSSNNEFAMLIAEDHPNVEYRKPDSALTSFTAHTNYLPLLLLLAN